MRPDKQNINFVNKEVVNYSAIANKAKSLSDGIRSIDFDRINDSITFNSSLVHNRPKIQVKPSNNSVNNVSEMNFNDNSTLTGITSDSSNTDPTKAISSAIMIDVNNRIEKLETKTQNQSATENETTFTGNVQADTFNGYNLKTVGNYHKLPEIVVINERSVVEIGRNLDFHDSTSTSVDYNGRISYKKNYFHCSDKFVVENGKDIQAANIISSKGNLNNIIDRTVALETKNTEQDTRLDTIETKNTEQDTRLTNIETKNTEQDTRLTNIETKTQNQSATENETTFTGNITANTFNGFHLGMNDRFYNIPAIPVINDDLVMEVGRYIDFHYNASTGTDYTARLHITKYGNLHFNHSFIIDGSDIKAKNCIADGGNLNDIASRTKSIETKNTEQDTRLTNIETKNTEQDTRLTNIETKNTEQDTLLTNLQKADGILHEESVRYYDYSREHIEEIENTKIPAINTKNTEQDTRLSAIESKNTEQDEKLDNIINESEKYINDKTLSLVINNVQKEEGASDYPISDEYHFQLNPVSDDIYLKPGPHAQLYLTITWIKHDEAGIAYGQSYEDIYVSYDGNNVTVNAIEFTNPTFDIATKTLIVPYPTGYNYTLRTFEYTEAALKELYCYHSYVIAQPFSNNIIDLIYPVGSIYLTFNKSPPLFGIWELIDDGKFLMSTALVAGEFGGTSEHVHQTADHVLTVDEMPSHTHPLRGYGRKLGSGSTGWRYGAGGSQITDDTMLSTGGNQPHNHGYTVKARHIPPYITCYMYKRTA